MSLIRTIRQRSGIAVGIVALGLGLFVVGGDIIGPGGALFSGDRSVGEINGNTIKIEELQAQTERLEQVFTVQNGRSPNEQEQQGLREQAWNLLIYRYVYEPEMDRLGMAVPTEEVEDMIVGRNTHPAVRQAFSDPQTGEFNREGLLNFVRNLRRAQPEQQFAWRNFREQLPQDRARTKYSNLITKTSYVTRQEALREYAHTNTIAEYDYFFVNYASIPDTAVNVTDAELESYLRQHPYRFRTQRSRSIDYVEFRLEASEQDRTSFYEDMTRLASEFASADNDTAFAAQNSDVPSQPLMAAPNQLPQELQRQSLQQGQVYGPFPQGANVVLYKVSDISRGSGQFVTRASHILFKPSDASDTAKASARARAQRILNQIKGGANFEDMARQYGSDGTASQGGDLGYFDQQTMVKPFGDAVFGRTTTGLIPDLVVTDFGFHIVKVTEPKSDVKYRIAQLTRAIGPSDETTEGLYQAAARFQTAAATTRTPEEFREIAREQGLNVLTANGIQPAARGFNDLAEAREVVRWAYDKDRKRGNVSEPFQLTDRFVVAMLSQQTEEGRPKLDDVRDAVRARVVNEKKAAQIIAKLGVEGNGKPTTQPADLAALQQKYGAPASYSTTGTTSLQSMAMPEVGYDPETVGRVFGLRDGMGFGPVAGESGVVAVRLRSLRQPAALGADADLSTYRQTIEQRNQGRVQYYIDEALKEVANIQDNRVRFQ